MRSPHWIACVALLVSCEKAEEPSAEIGEEPTMTVAKQPELTVEELTSALNVKWAQYTLPGDEDDVWAVGAVLEYGDGRKARKTGMASPFRGGTDVKVVLWRDGETLNCSIISRKERKDGSGFSQRTSHGSFPNHPRPIHVMYLGGQIEWGDYMMKGSAAQAADIVSGPILEEHQFGLRLIVKPVDTKEEASKTVPN